MLKEINCADSSRDEIAEALQAVINTEYPLVLRGGLDFMPVQDWEAFLEKDMGWTMDKRHFKKDPNAEDKVESMYSHDMHWWEVSYQPELATSYAFSKTRQPLHTDYAWYRNGAQINFDIMKKQAKSGGEQVFYPLSRIMSDLQAREPQLLNDLMSTTVKIGKGADEPPNVTSIITTKSVDGRDEHRIYWNYYRTDKSDKDVDDMCEAFFAFLEGQRETSSVGRNRCNSGDCFSLHDARQLHGREAFEATEPFERILLQSGWWYSNPGAPV